MHTYHTNHIHNDITTHSDLRPTGTPTTRGSARSSRTSSPPAPALHSVICVYIYIHIYIHMYIYISIYVCMCIYIYIHMLLYIYIYTHTHTHTLQHRIVNMISHRMISYHSTSGLSAKVVNGSRSSAEGMPWLEARGYHQKK